MVNNNFNSTYVHYPCKIEKEHETFVREGQNGAKGFRRASDFAAIPRRRNSIRRVACDRFKNSKNSLLSPNTCKKTLPYQNVLEPDICCMVIIGEFSVGKSALCQNFFRNENFHQSPMYHRECFTKVEKNHHVYERPLNLGNHPSGESRRIRLLDVNTERHLQDFCVDHFASMTSYIDIGDAFIVVYAITNAGTFKTARETLEHLEKLRKDSDNKKFALVLVGNKCDLVRKRQVSTEEGVKVAAEFGAKFIETSAMLDVNTNELFEGTFQQVMLRSSPNAEWNKIGCDEEGFVEKSSGSSLRSSFRRSFRLSRSRSLRCSKRKYPDTALKSSKSFSLKNQDEKAASLSSKRSRSAVLKMLKNLAIGGKKASMKNKFASCQDFTKI